MYKKLHLYYFQKNKIKPTKKKKNISIQTYEKMSTRVHICMYANGDGY